MSINKEDFYIFETSLNTWNEPQPDFYCFPTLFKRRHRQNHLYSVILKLETPKEIFLMQEDCQFPLVDREERSYGSPGNAGTKGTEEALELSRKEHGYRPSIEMDFQNIEL